MGGNTKIHRLIYRAANLIPNCGLPKKFGPSAGSFSHSYIEKCVRRLILGVPMLQYAAIVTADSCLAVNRRVAV